MNPVAPETATLIVRSRSSDSANVVGTRCGTVPQRRGLVASLAEG